MFGPVKSIVWGRVEESGPAVPSSTSLGTITPPLSLVPNGCHRPLIARTEPPWPCCLLWMKTGLHTAFNEVLAAAAKELNTSI